jgi:hypothetical protein
MPNPEVGVVIEAERQLLHFVGPFVKLSKTLVAVSLSGDVGIAPH